VVSLAAVALISRTSPIVWIPKEQTLKKRFRCMDYMTVKLILEK
jgi:hypothetical protein